MDILKNGSLIGWIFTILFIVILVCGFFVGFWRGFKKSWVNSIFALIGALIAFFVTPTITNAVLNIQIPYDNKATALKDIIVNLIKDNKDVGTMIQNNKNIEFLVQNIPSAVFNTLVFILVTIAIEFVLYLIYKIVSVAFLKGPKKGRLFGGLVGLAKTFVIAIFAFMPLAGLIGFANEVVCQNDYSIASIKTGEENQKPEGLLSSIKEVEEYKPVLSGLYNNLWIKSSMLFGLGSATFDYYSSIKLDDGTVNLRKTGLDIVKLADFGYQLSNVGFENVDYQKIDYKKVENILNSTLNSTLYNSIISPTIKDIIINYDQYSFIGSDFKYPDILIEIGEKLQNDEGDDYFKNDIKQVFEGVKTLGKSGLINNIMKVEDKSDIKAIAKALTEKIDDFKSGLNSILKANLIQDGMDKIVGKIFEKIELSVDEIKSNLQDEEWDEVGNSIVKMVKLFTEIPQDVPLKDVLSDFEILLDKEKDYDINTTLTKLGQLLDEARANKLLQNKDDQPIVDSLLKSYNIDLPSDSTFENYQELFGGKIAPALTKIRDEGIYEIISKSGGDLNETVQKLVDIISQSGKQNLLSEIFLPLLEVEPTKSLIKETMSNSLNSDFLNFSLLQDEDWESELNLISKILIKLNEKDILSDALSGDFSNVIDSIEEADVDEIIGSILQAKSTKNIKSNIVQSLISAIDEFSGKSTSAQVNDEIFEGSDSQNSEICEVLKKVILLKNEGTNKQFDELDSTLLGNLIEAIKSNAYRVELEGKTSAGVLKESFNNLMTKLKETYSTEISYIESNEDAKALIGLEKDDQFNEQTYFKIDFSKLLTKIDEIKNLV